MQHIFNRMNPQMQEIIRYIDLQRTADCERILKKIENSKRSILYDLGKMMKTMNSMTPFGGPNNASSNKPLTSEILNVRFPIKTHEEFLIFEQSLSAMHEETRDEDRKVIEHSGLAKKKVLVSTFWGWVGSEDTWKDCVRKCMNCLLHKDVQKIYSGRGRQTILSRKEAFDKTASCECIKEFLLKKFPSTTMDIVSYIGNHLSQAQGKKK
ncbi:uncharacterized protein [Fopius arisanus]|uniref:Uncharacterized protein n=1 Tax=Fopius arisanus TaxID=64838 RepID=A0A9R1T3S0_9HYME|nr:PREDICTED: uncharacterized protein LOC105266000 [Fopius arisanus]